MMKIMKLFSSNSLPWLSPRSSSSHDELKVIDFEFSDTGDWPIELEEGTLLEMSPSDVDGFHRHATENKKGGFNVLSGR